MDDIGINGRLAWMCMGMLAQCMSKPWSMLAMDAFHGHLSDRIRNGNVGSVHVKAMEWMQWMRFMVISPIASGMGMLAWCVSKPWSMLAMDAFHGHLSDRIRNRLRNKNTNLVIIPSGMTSQLQPLDVSVNKPLKRLVHKHCDVWLNKGNHTLTPSGKIKRASASIIVEWI
jgi:hypothetical protein